jgi:hypothetical protein
VFLNSVSMKSGVAHPDPFSFFCTGALTILRQHLNDNGGKCSRGSVTRLLMH